MAVYYLDIDDEITSAAARIRGTDDVSVVLVLPAGSRIATSRINFRLLAREALQRNRRLAIVAPEASARALAATAGLPVFASTREYEATLSEAAAAAAAAEAAPAPAPAGGVVVPAADRPAAPRSGSKFVVPPAGGSSRRRPKRLKPSITPRPQMCPSS